MPGQAHAVEILVYGNTKDLEAKLARAGIVAEESGSKIGGAFTTGAEKAGGALTKLGQTASGWGVPFAASLVTVGKHLDATESKTKKLHATLSEAGKVTLLAGGAGLAVAGAEAVKLGVSYETAQAKIQAATGATGKSVQDLTHHFEATAGTSMESGQTMEAAYAGVAAQLKLTEGHALSTAEAMKVSAAANNLAESGAASLAEAYSGTARVLETFHLSASHAAEVSDTLYSTSKATNAPVEQIASSMSKLHARLGDVAPSMGDVSGLMVALSERGLTGSRGILAVSSAFQTLLGNSKTTTAVLRDLGVNLYDSQGRFIGLQNAIAALQPKLAALPEHERRYAESALLGKSATELLGKVVLAGVPAFQQATNASNRHAAALTAAQQQEKTFSGEMKTLKATVETLGGALGVILIPKVEAVAKALANGVQWFEKHATAAKVLAGVITGVLGTAVAVFAYDKAAAFVGGTKRMLTGLGELVLGTRAAAGEMGAAEGTMVAETDTAAAGIDTAIGSTGVGLILVGLGIAAVELEQHWKTVMGALESATAVAGNAIIDILNRIIRGFNETIGELTGAIPEIEKLHTAAEQSKSEREGVGNERGVTAPGGKAEEAANLAEGAGGAAPGHGRGVEQQVLKFWESKGFSPAAAAGFVGNAALESGLNVHEGGGGLYQQSGLGAAGAARVAGEGITGQSQEVLKRLPPSLIATLKNIKDPRLAASLIEHQFEKPAGSQPGEAGHGTAEEGTAHLRQREEAAAKALGHGNPALQQQMEEASGAKPKKGAAHHAKQVAAALGIPAGVGTMIATAQALLGTPYKLGGGHGSSANDPIEMLKKIGIDCSGFVSKVLSSGGVPNVSGLTTEGLAEHLKPGAGRYATVWDRANAGGDSHTLIQILGKWFEEGGKAASGSAKMLTGAQAREELAGGGFKPFHSAQLNSPVRGGLNSASLKAGTAASEAEASAAEKTAKAAETRLTALEAAGKKLLGEGQGHGNLQQAIQSGGVPQLEKILGVSTGGKGGGELDRFLTALTTPGGTGIVPHETHERGGLWTNVKGPVGGGELTQDTLTHSIMPMLSKQAAGTPQGKAFDALVKELKATHQAGMVALAQHLEQAHKQALADLGRELYAVSQEKQAQLLTNETTEAKDRTTQAANLAAKQLQLSQDQTSEVTDAMQGSARAIDDVTQIIKNTFGEMAQEVKDATQEMVDTASGEVQAKKDQSAVVVAELGERGKYGLDLIAQKLEVQLDQMRAGYDVQIQQSRISLDQAKTQQNQLVAAKQQAVALEQQREDVILAGDKAHVDAERVAQDNILIAAQSTVDSVQLAADTRSDLAQMTTILVAGGTKAQQDAAKGWQMWAGAQGTKEVTAAETHLTEAQSGANAAIAAARSQLSQAEAQAQVDISNAQQALAQAEGNAQTIIAGAEQALTGIEDTAKVAEAGLESEIDITKAEAATQYAGSGLVVNFTNIPSNDSAAIAGEMGWLMRTQLPA